MPAGSKPCVPFSAKPCDNPACRVAGAGATQKRNCLNMLGSFFAFVFLVGVTRLELATSRPPDAYSNQLSYTPSFFKSDAKLDTFFYPTKFLANFFSVPGVFFLFSKTGTYVVVYAADRVGD